MSMTIQRYIPHRLKGVVDLIWEQHSDTPTRWSILPSGKIELIFQLGTVARMRSAAKINNQDNPLELSCFLSGLHTRPLNLSFDRFHNFGIQMRPIAAKALFGIPLKEVRDYYLEGSDFLNRQAEIEDQLKSKATFIERAAFIEDIFLAQLAETADLHQAISLHDFADKIILHKLLGRNVSIEQSLGYSRTQTFRIFNDWFGLSSHSYLRLLQFVKSVQILHHSPGKLIQVGFGTGYYDQAHFIRSFKEFSGMTPAEYRKLKTEIPGQLPY